MKKGSYGYIKKKRKKLMLWLLLDIAVAVGIFVLGLVLNNFSNKNIFTVLAMLFTLPGAKIFVSLVVIFPYKGFTQDVYDKVRVVTNNYEEVLYDLVLTSPERVMYIKSMMITDDEYVILPDDIMLKAKDSKKYIEYMKMYIGKHMSNYGFEKNIVIINDEYEYIDKLVEINSALNNDKSYESNNLHSKDNVIKTLLILEV